MIVTTDELAPGPADTSHLAAVLADAAAGRFPAADGRATFLSQVSARDAGVLSFTGHAVVFADVDPAWLAAQLPAGDYAAPLSVVFLHALGARLGRAAGSIDLLACASSLAGPPPVRLGDESGQAHPRIQRALRYRDDVRAWQAEGGVVLLGRGVAGRWEVAIEVDPDCRERGLGRQLATAARHLVPAGETLWAQIAPGNAASVRAFLAAGFVPVGAEVLFSPHGVD